MDHDQFMRDYLHLFKPTSSTREGNQRKRSTSAHQTNTGQLMYIILVQFSTRPARVAELPFLRSKLQTAEERKKAVGAERKIDELGLKLRAITNIAIIQ